MSKTFWHFVRKLSTSAHLEKTPQVCIVGSGPAGFYFAQHLFKLKPDVMIDMYEKLPVPFGLVRYGVAPDHPEVKNVINTFTKTAGHPNFRFFGNVELGKDVMFKDLKRCYHAVVMAYGCSEDTLLGIEGEGAKNVLSARRFVGWYNGLPSDKNLEVDLQMDVAVVIGQGNVAIDVTRILLTPVDILKKTDITSYSLEALSESKIKEVYLVGRRGPLQAAFTIKEFREMTKLPGVQTVFRQEQITPIEPLVADLPRPRKRLSELLIKTMRTEQNGDRKFNVLFFRKPKQIITEVNKVKGVTFQVTMLVDSTEGRVTDTNDSETLECGLVLRSIGYKSSCPDPHIPYDSKSGCVPSDNGVYSSGWISSGPVGVILTTMNNAFHQAALLASHIDTKVIDASVPKPGHSFIEQILAQKSIDVVDFDGWKKIDAVERERGESAGKPREKIVDIAEMLSIAK